MSESVAVRELERRLRRLSERPPPPGSTVATGLPALDRILPAGGLPRGRATEWWGVRSAGKTALLRHVLLRLATSGEAAAVVDADGTLYAPDWEGPADRAPRFWVLRPDSPDEALWCADLLLRSRVFGAVALVFEAGRAHDLGRTDVVRLQRSAAEAGAVLVVEDRCPVAGLRLRFEPGRVEALHDVPFGPRLPEVRPVWARVPGAGRAEVPILCPEPHVGVRSPADGRDRKGRR